MLENLRIGRVVVHEVFQRNSDRAIVTPSYGAQLENLSFDALEAFKQRVVEALSARAKSVEMTIRRSGAGSFLSAVEGIVGRSDDVFLLASREVADRLAEAQLGQNIPGGMLIVFEGTVGQGSQPYLGVIKAEIQDGFRRRRDGTAITTEFINDLFLTRAQRLFKVGLMVKTAAPTPSGLSWRAFVFDHNIVSGNREAAAQYFYESYLGCIFSEDSAYETGRFFDLTKEFIVRSIADKDERHGAIDALYTYVKSDLAPTFTVDEFAERYVPEELRDRYDGYMKGRQFPERAIVRNTSQMTAKLRRRRFKYGTDIEFLASPEALHEGRALIETQNALSETGHAETWTMITIKAPYTGET